MITDKQYTNWKLNLDEDNLLWLTIDRQNESSNVLDTHTLNELSEITDELVTSAHIAGVIIRSGKKNGFIAGANIEEFLEFKTAEDAHAMVRRVQDLFDRIAALPMPTVALIHGFCLGGGMELALSCRYRVVEKSASTQLGLPEVKLGIQPGWGGTVRMPRLIGAPKALDLMLSGRTLRGPQAAKWGVADAAVLPAEMERAARYYALSKPKPRDPGLFAKIVNIPFIRPWVAKGVYNKLSAKIKKEHYPAPFAMVKNWVKVGDDLKQGMVVEARSIADLFTTPTAGNLIRVFFLQQKMKSLAKLDKTFKPKHVHVIGAGTMGGDIAAWCAFRGFTVTLQDQAPERIAPAIGRAYKLYKKKLKKSIAITPVMDRLQPDPEGLGVKHADVVIEAIFENLEAKQELFSKLEPIMKKEAILATNTSSIPLDELNTVLKSPERLVGIHFFNPVAMMQLVEVVCGAKTDKAVIKKAQAFVGKISRLPLPVKSSPGFLVNRVLMPYLMEAMTLLEDGVKPSKIDKAAKDFGMPMGPIQLADTIGLDVCLSVADNLVGVYGGTVPEKLRHMVEKGDLGAKSGQGFYKYVKGKKVKDDSASKDASTGSSRISKDDICDRMILRMLNEAVACLREDVISDAELLDGGMIFGTGFAPFRGGPINYAKSRGIDVVVQRLEQFQSTYGDRFKPDEGWDKVKAESGATTKAPSFHSKAAAANKPAENPAEKSPETTDDPSKDQADFQAEPND